MHVLGGAGGDDAEHPVRGVVRVNIETALRMGSDKSPTYERCLKVAAIQHLHRCAVRVFDDVEVVEQHLSFGQHAEHELPPGAVVADGAAGSHAPVPNFLPDRASRLLARRPGLGLRVVCVGIAEFEARSTARGKVGPAPLGCVADLVHGHAADVAQCEPLSGGRQPTVGRTQRRNAGMVEHEADRVCCDHEIASGLDRCAERKVVDERVDEAPAVEHDRLVAPVVELDPVAGVRGCSVVLQVADHQLRDDDVARERRRRSLLRLRANQRIHGHREPKVSARRRAVHLDRDEVLSGHDQVGRDAQRLQPEACTKCGCGAVDGAGRHVLAEHLYAVQIDHRAIGRVERDFE